MEVKNVDWITFLDDPLERKFPPAKFTFFNIKKFLELKINSQFQ